MLSSLPSGIVYAKESDLNDSEAIRIRESAEEPTEIYQENTATPDITIASKTVIAIAVDTKPTTLVYKENKDDFDPTGGTIKVYYSDSTNQIIDMTAHMVSSFDNSLVGMQPLTVTYSERTATFTVEVALILLSSVS